MGKQVPLIKKSEGFYLLKVAFVGGGEMEITVDSGAEEWVPHSGGGPR